MYRLSLIHISLLIMKPYFRTFTNNEEIYQLSIAYMGVCSFMQIPNMVHIAIQKMIQATGNMVAPMSVSYTHLDVYKRQPYQDVPEE